MYYFMILLAVVLLALQFSTNKYYQLHFGNAVPTSLLFTTLNGLTTALLFFCINGFKISITPYSFLMASIIAILCCIYTLISFKIFSLGSLSIYSMFLMLGGMLLPYLYGVIWLHENINVIRVLGLILLVISMIFPVLENKNEKNTPKTKVLFLILCLLVFALNGFVSITSKIHQISPQNTVGTIDFVILSNGINGFISAISLLIICLIRKTTPISESLTFKNLGWISLIISSSAVCNGSSYMFQLIGAANVPASVLYPLVTGGMVILSALAGMLLFHEYPSKQSTIGIVLSFAATFLFLF